MSTFSRLFILPGCVSWLSLIPSLHLLFPPVFFFFSRFGGSKALPVRASMQRCYSPACREWDPFFFSSCSPSPPPSFYPWCYCVLYGTIYTVRGQAKLSWAGVFFLFFFISHRMSVAHFWGRVIVCARRLWGGARVDCYGAVKRSVASVHRQKKKEKKGRAGRQGVNGLRGNSKCGKLVFCLRACLLTRLPKARVCVFCTLCTRPSARGLFPISSTRMRSGRQGKRRRWIAQRDRSAVMKKEPSLFRGPPNRRSACGELCAFPSLWVVSKINVEKT